MKAITRTVKTVIVNVSEIAVENGEIITKALPAVEVLEGETNDKALMRYARKEYGKEKNLVVTGYDVSETLYAMPLEKFIENAEVVK